ncbi:adapter protein MecA 1/2 [Lachnospiraceae bacterium]|nr:adapter protein MecA 1/2 [Lachnospiraceae bacterium]
MKIERLNENQLRFTVWSNDLPDEDFTIADLAGQTEKAEELIKYMMNKAREEFGFVVNEQPLVVEAIPVNKDCIVFLVTKVDSEDEDNHFSYVEKLKKQAMDMAKSIKNGKFNPGEDVYETEDTEEREKEAETVQRPLDEKTGKILPYMIYKADDVEQFITVAKMVRSFYNSDNTLYKNESPSSYFLIVTHNKNSEKEFEFLCETLREFSEPYKFTYTTKYYFEEHYKLIIRDNALQMLADI